MLKRITKRAKTSVQHVRAAVPLVVFMLSPGVPTVWLNLLQHVKKHNLKLKYVKRVCIAGSAPPRSMIEALEK